MLEHCIQRLLCVCRGAVGKKPSLLGEYEHRRLTSISTQPESVKRWVFGRLDEQGLTKDINWRTYDVMLKEPYRRQILRDRVDRLQTLDFTIPLFGGATQDELREFGNSINDIQTQFNEAATQSAGRYVDMARRSGAATQRKTRMF
ncbi:hypothetical protein BDV33DRAFT_207829 [Aspergillus novoparasiticus]|uniref:Uncharacterized protein n=1 Tax=Aspergillus novoparasiticus TaxID=986946 RepID=A0A5N6EHR7_9EURO|nr:hypothetical protein BDV33DRAFT_207829 [Aspergillus novoparasiticus]